MVGYGEKLPAAQSCSPLCTPAENSILELQSFRSDCTASASASSTPLSHQLDLEIWRDNLFLGADLLQGAPTSKLQKDGQHKKRGTKVHFCPTKRSSPHRIQLRYAGAAPRELAFLNKGPGDHAHR